MANMAPIPTNSPAIVASILNVQLIGKSASTLRSLPKIATRPTISQKLAVRGTAVYRLTTHQTACCPNRAIDTAYQSDKKLRGG